jgi:Eisosome protein 1
VARAYSSSTTSRSVLDEDGKLSSAGAPPCPLVRYISRKLTDHLSGAATSLKYARPQDLPSFPSPGLKLASAGAAASLAESNKKPFEHWKPDAIPDANKAALHAHGYEMDPLWQPEMSAAGSKAAMLAQRDGGNVDIWRPTASETGSSAAGQAMGMKQPGAVTERDIGADGRSKALLAATGALASGRRRAESAPIKPQPDNSWAVGAATKSHRGAIQNQAYFGKGDPGFEAARIQNMAKGSVSRSMYGSNPPVAIEVEERNRQATLRASAVAMAQKMYAVQQSHIDEAKGRVSESRHAAREVHRRGLSDSLSDLGEEPDAVANKYGNLEEAARKLAMERLARLHDENAEYRSYYGQPTTPTRPRLSLRGRRRSSSDGQLDMDEEQSKKIRSQMSIFQSKLAAVDSKKRQDDRDAVLAAAQKNVAERMATLDEKVFQETGKPSPHQTEMWEKAAREKAQADSDTRMVNHGKVHIGGGKYLDQAEVEAIARARLQPTLDEIADTAEKRRAHDEELRLEEEKRKRDAETERLRAAETKAEMKRTRGTLNAKLFTVVLC